jgi:hypothetical protein
MPVNPKNEAEQMEALQKELFIVRPTENTAAFISAPFSSYLSFFTSMRGSSCDFFERQWLDCASAVGKHAAKFSKCVDEFDDLNECITKNKSFKRYQRMQEERQKTGVKYQKPPPVDTLQPLKYKTNHSF